MMRRLYTLEIGYLCVVIAVSLVASIGRAPAFVVSLVGFAALLGLAWKVAPGRRAARPATQ